MQLEEKFLIPIVRVIGIFLGVTFQAGVEKFCDFHADAVMAQGQREVGLDYRVTEESHHVTCSVCQRAVQCVLSMC